MAVDNRWTAAQIESALRELKNVCAAKVVTSDVGLIQEVHLLIEGNRDPRRVVRDVESVLMAHFGLRIDHRKVSVAQKETVARGSEFSRLRCIDVHVMQEGTRAHVTVLLERANQPFSGTATGSRASSNIPRLVVTATLRAVESAFGLQERFALEDLQANLLLAGRTVVVVLLSVLSDAGEDLLTGSALLRQDLYRAVISATLDALNRRVTLLPADQSPQMLLSDSAVVSMNTDSLAESERL